MKKCVFIPLLVSRLNNLWSHRGFFGYRLDLFVEAIPYLVGLFPHYGG